MLAEVVDSIAVGVARIAVVPLRRKRVEAVLDFPTVWQTVIVSIRLYERRAD